MCKLLSTYIRLSDINKAADHVSLSFTGSYGVNKNSLVLIYNFCFTLSISIEILLIG